VPEILMIVDNETDTHVLEHFSPVVIN